MNPVSTLAAFAVLCAATAPNLFGANNKTIELTALSSVASITPGASAAEIVAHDPGTQRIFVVNAVAGKIDASTSAIPRSRK